MPSSLFTQPLFLKSSNFYEVNIRQYTTEGTFNAFASHLPRLKNMGVQILWLMPIHPIGLINRKGFLGSYYSVKDYCSVNQEYGTAEDFKNLVLEVHALGMKIIIDWVANHAAWDNVWTTTNPDFFVQNEEGKFINAYDWDDVIQINHSNPAQQVAMIKAMDFWVKKFDIDGFRADLAHLTPLPFWKNARLQLSSSKKDLVWLAETEDPHYHDAFDVSYTWQWMHHIELFVKGEKPLRDCITALETINKTFPENALRMYFTSNHDENSWNGTEYEKYGIFAEPLAVFSCLYDSVPLIYSGQEIPNKKRLQFFDRDTIGFTKEPALHQFYKKLLSLRRLYKYVFENNEFVFIENLIAKNILGFTIKKNDNCIVVLLNLNNFRVQEHILIKNVEGNFTNFFTEQKVEVYEKIIFNANAGSYVVLVK